MRTVNPIPGCPINGPPDGYTWVAANAGGLGSGWANDWVGGCGTSPRNVPALPTTYDGGSNGIKIACAIADYKEIGFRIGYCPFEIP